MNAISPKGSPLAERFSCPSGMTEHYPRVEGPSESPGDGWTVRVAAAMFPVAAAERMALMTALGDGWEVQDGRRVERADAVLLLPCSGQTVAAVRRRFPDARIVLVDSPLESATHPAGPIHRVLEAGADSLPPSRRRHRRLSSRALTDVGARSAIAQGLSATLMKCSSRQPHSRMMVRACPTMPVRFAYPAKPKWTQPLG